MSRTSDARRSIQGKRLHAICPHCGVPAAVRSSRPITPTYKQFYFDCRNDACGHSWLAELHVVHTITPSARPNPAVQIKNGPSLAQMLRAQMLNQSGEGAAGITGPPANDDEAVRQQG